MAAVPTMRSMCHVKSTAGFSSGGTMGTPRRTFYKGASWLFELPPAQWTRLRKQYPDLDVERG